MYDAGCKIPKLSRNQGSCFICALFVHKKTITTFELEEKPIITAAKATNSVKVLSR